MKRLVLGVGPVGLGWKADAGIQLAARIAGVALQLSYARSLTDGRRTFSVRSFLDR